MPRFSVAVLALLAGLIAAPAATGTHSVHQAKGSERPTPRLFMEADTATAPTRKAEFALLSGEQTVPAHWNRCTPITYRVNPVGAPRGGGKEVRQALARISKITGYRFVYQGKSSIVPFATADWSQREQAAHVSLVIAWATAKQVPGLRGATIGIGGGTWYPTTATAPGSGRFIAGGAVFERRQPLRGGFGSGMRRGVLVQHELGHAMGLTHVADPRQIMAPAVTTRSPATFAAGDVSGLKRLSAIGCATT